MYTLEERMKVVRLYIESGFKEGAVIKALGHPSPNTIRAWYREYVETGKLHEASAPKPRFTQEQKIAAVRYYRDNHASITQTCRAMGYPCRDVLKRWIKEICPEALVERREAQQQKSCNPQRNRVKFSLEEKREAVTKLVVNNVPDYKVAAEYGVCKTTIHNWKRQILGKDELGSMQEKKLEKAKADVPRNQACQETVDKLKAEVAELEEKIFRQRLEYEALLKASEILKKAGGINLRDLTNLEKAEVIDALRPQYRLNVLLPLFSIAKSSYCYAHNASIAPDKYAAQRLSIVAEFKSSEGRYGYRRVGACLKRARIKLSEKVVRRIMKEENLIIHHVRKQKYSSYKGEISPEVPNLLNRNFHEDAPNKKWLTDITEFALPAGKVYLSPVVDCFDGMLVSWTIGTSPNAQLANDMLDQAILKLRPEEHPIVHSDRGCHYRWPGWIERMAEAHLTRSMSRKGCSPDNSACEGLFGRIKNEMFYGKSWRGVSLEQFKSILDSYLHWYNEKRIKASLGWKSPVEYRQSLLTDAIN